MKNQLLQRKVAREGRGTKGLQDKQKTGFKNGSSMSLSIIALNVNTLNSPIQRPRVAE